MAIFIYITTGYLNAQKISEMIVFCTLVVPQINGILRIVIEINRVAVICPTFEEKSCCACFKAIPKNTHKILLFIIHEVTTNKDIIERHQK